MAWYEFLEGATERMQNNREAAAVRRELFTHLSFLADDLQATGMTLEEARREALARMGDPERLRDAFSPPPAPATHESAIQQRISVLDRHPVVLVRWALRLLSLAALTMSLLYVGHSGSAPSIWAPDIVSLMPGLALLWWAQRYTPRLADHNEPSWLDTLAHNKMLWLTGAVTGALAGMEPLLANAFASPFSMLYRLAVPGITIPNLALVVAVGWTRRNCHLQGRPWNPFASSGILLGSFSLVGYVTVALSNGFMQQRSANIYSLYFSHGFVYIFTTSFLMLAAQVLLLTSLATEYGLPREPGQGPESQSQPASTPEWVWPVLGSQPWLTWLTKRWRLLGCGMVIGMWSGLLGVGDFGGAFVTLALAAGFVCALAAGLYGVGKPLWERHKGKRDHSAASVAASLWMGFVMGAVTVAAESPANGFYLVTREAFVFGLFIFSLCAVAFAGFALWRRYRRPVQSSSE